VGKSERLFPEALELGIYGFILSEKIETLRYLEEKRGRITEALRRLVSRIGCEDLSFQELPFKLNIRWRRIHTKTFM